MSTRLLHLMQRGGGGGGLGLGNGCPGDSAGKEMSSQSCQKVVLKGKHKIIFFF